MDDLAGLTAAITGVSSWIGAATAALFATRGARVVVLDIQAPRDLGPRFISCDVASTESVAAALRAIEAEFGGLDILVNNAGIGAQGDVAAQDAVAWHRVLDVNVVGIARATAAALPMLRRSDHAAIVNTSSVVAAIGVPDRALYAATKGAVSALTLAMAADHVRDGIRVNAVAPGTTDTPWVAGLLASADDPAVAAEALRRRQPIGWLVSADEVAAAIAYLASPLAGSTTGTILGVDGGMGTLRLPST